MASISASDLSSLDDERRWDLPEINNKFGTNAHKPTVLYIVIICDNFSPCPIMLRQTLKVLIQTDLLFPFCRSHKEGAGSLLFHFGIACAPCHLGLGHGSVKLFHEDDLIKMISEYPVFSENWWCQCQGWMEGCCKKNLVAIPPLPSSSEVQIRSLDLQHANHTCK